MHHWGDKGVDWKGIEDAAAFIGRNLRRWGRVDVSQTKEKYGTARVYCSFGFYEVLHGFFYPGHSYYHMPAWLVRVDHFISFKLHLGQMLTAVMVPYQKRLYTFLYGRALKKWPHLRMEILSGADWSELLRPYGVHVIQMAPGLQEVRYDGPPEDAP